MPDINERFPLVEIRGGPHGHNSETIVDGVKLKGVHRVELVVDVNDAIRLKTFQLVRVGIQLTGEHSSVFSADVMQSTEDGSGYTILAHSDADTLWEAVADCARQLELAAKANDTGVAQAGTI